MSSRSRFPQPCIDCGTLTTNGTRCEGDYLTRRRAHDKARDTPERKAKKKLLYGGDYQKQANLIRDHATECYLCGGGPRPADPFEADHIDAGNPASALLPAHRSCNQSRGNRPPLPGQL